MPGQSSTGGEGTYQCTTSTTHVLCADGKVGKSEREKDMINYKNCNHVTQERVVVKDKENYRNRRLKKGKNTVTLISKNGTSQTWVQVDVGKCFVTARDPMPPWKYVVRRVTYDLETRNIVEDLWAC